MAAKLRNEVKSVMGSRTEPNYEDYKKLSYTTAVWKEVLRLYPPAPLTVRHLCEDLELENIVVPKGTMVYMPIWWIHRDPRNWSEPDRFLPERFMVHDDKAGQGRSFKNFFAFSGGSRNCVGKRFALLEGTILLAKLGLNFDFSIPEDAPEVKPTSLGVVQEAAHGIWLAVANSEDCMT